MAEFRAYVEVEARRWVGNNVDEIRDFCGTIETTSGTRALIRSKRIDYKRESLSLYMPRYAAWVPLRVGEWLVKDLSSIERYTAEDFTQIFGRKK